MADEPPREPLLGPAWVGHAQKGVVVIALGAMAGGVLLAFFAINDVIATWLEDRWVPVWRALFAVLVVALAVWVLTRLTGRRLV